MALEDYINSLNNRPTLRGVEKAKQERLEQEVMEKGKTEADFLEEIKKAEQEKREGIEHFAKQVPQFLSQVDECVSNYHIQHQSKKNRHEIFSKYDELLAKLREAIEIFLSNIADKEFVELLEHDIATISDLCKKMYKLDNAFPNFAFLDGNKFKEAAIKEIYRDSGMAKGVKFEKVGRFTVVGKENNFYSILDQQAQKAFKKEICAIGKVRNNSIVIGTYTSGFFGDLENRIFSGETGETSEGYSKIEPTIGDLWVAKQRGGFYSFDILNAKGKIIHQSLSKYIPNKNKTRILIRKDFYGGGYNILLEDGSLLLNSEYTDIQNANESIRDETIVKDVILKSDGKFIRLDPNLEIIAEGESIEDVTEKVA